MYLPICLIVYFDLIITGKIRSTVRTAIKVRKVLYLYSDIAMI